MRKALALLLLLGALGCGGVKNYPVEGKVVWADGSGGAVELAGGAVEFETNDASLAPEERVSARGQINSDATFIMGTAGPGDGVPAGTYRVLVTESFRDPDRRGAPPILDPRFRNYDSSGLQVTVEPKSNTFTLTIERLKR